MELNIVTLDDLILVDAPRDICLYSKGGREAVQQLITLATQIQEDQKGERILPKGIVLLQAKDADDFVKSWETELKFEGTQRETYENILDFRWLLYLVRHSIVPWYYVSVGHVMGSHWELALSCQYRYSFAQAARFGFPEIVTGIFVPGGILESLAKHTIKVREKWHSQHTLSSYQCYKEGLIQYWVAGYFAERQGCPIRVAEEYVQKKILALLKNRVQGKSSSSARTVTGFSSLMVANTLDLFMRRSVPSKMTRIDLKARDDFYTEFQFKVAEFMNEAQRSHVTAWDFCWQMVQERTTPQKPLKSAAGVTRIAAVALYQSRYIDWISQQCNLSEMKSHHATPLQLDVRPRYELSIDVTDGYPPIESLIDLAEGQVVTLQSRLSRTEFKQALEILYSRLDRTIGHAAAAKLWGKQVLWTIGSFKSPQFMLLKWIGFEKVICQVGDKFNLALRSLSFDLAGIHKSHLATDQVCEDFQTMQVLHTVSPRVLFLKSPKAKIPFEMVFRSLVLEQLIELGRTSGGDLAKVCENLRRMGWGFVADEESWHYYLKMAGDLTEFKTDLPELDRLIHSNSQFLWEVGSWKLARALARKDAVDVSLNPVIQSQQLAYFVGLMTKLISKALPEDDLKAIDQMARECLGFPTSYRSPLSYLRSLGARRERWLRHKYQT